MIGKLSLGKGAAALIRYCYYAKDEQGKLTTTVRGELLYSNEVYEARLADGRLNINDLAEQFHRVASTNTKTSKFIWHQTLNFHPDEKVSNEMMVTLARAFAKAFGFEHNQYLVFRHRDRANDHFHIVANRIDATGVNTASDQKNYERIQHWCRGMEKKYGLRPTDNHRQKLDARHNRSNRQAEGLKKVLDELIPRCRTMSELSIALRQKNITMYLSRGVSFTNKSSGVSFKGSDLGRGYSRSGIESRLGKNGLTISRDTFDGNQRQRLRDTIDRVVQQVPVSVRGNQISQERAWKVFGDQLHAEGITLRLVRNTINDPVAGVAFQAVGNRFVNGRELGEMYSHGVLSMRFGRSPEAFAQLVDRLIVHPKPTNEQVGLSPDTGEMSAKKGSGQVVGPNGAYETSKDLAKIAESLRSVAQRTRRPKI